jgi:cell division protein FtsB
VTQAAQARTARPRPLRSLLSALFVFLLLVLATAALKGWRDLDRSRDRETELKARILATEQRIETLRREIRDLQSDPATLERVAREDVGLVRPDEAVVVLPPEEPLR